MKIKKKELEYLYNLFKAINIALSYTCFAYILINLIKLQTIANFVIITASISSTFLIICFIFLDNTWGKTKLKLQNDLKSIDKNITLAKRIIQHKKNDTNNTKKFTETMIKDYCNNKIRKLEKSILDKINEIYIHRIIKKMTLFPLLCGFILTIINIALYTTSIVTLILFNKLILVSICLMMPNIIWSYLEAIIYIISVPFQNVEKEKEGLKEKYRNLDLHAKEKFEELNNCINDYKLNRSALDIALILKRSQKSNLSNEKKDNKNYIVNYNFELPQMAAHIAEYLTAPNYKFTSKLNDELSKIDNFRDNLKVKNSHLELLSNLSNNYDEYFERTV